MNRRTLESLENRLSLLNEQVSLALARSVEISTSQRGDEYEPNQVVQDYMNSVHVRLDEAIAITVQSQKYVEDLLV